MVYRSLEECILDLERNQMLVRIKEEVDPHLEMAAIHLRVHENKGPAILFEKVKGSKYRAVSNLFGTLERSLFIFRKTIPAIRQLTELRNNPMAALRNPMQGLKAIPAALTALPKKTSFNINQFDQIAINDLPLIHHWPKDGGAFVTLPQVYTEDPNQPGIMHSNIGMYRIQLNGNDYTLNKEVGLHYQLHRGIGIHQTEWNKKGEPMKVSVFVGGPPAHTVAAVMPLPEGLSEAAFAGALAGKRFRLAYHEGFAVSMDADFIITGEVYPNETKPEGPFGDHLGYYSLEHPFPVMRVKHVLAKRNAIWPFTVVGRPPQEDTSFGELIHQITGDVIPKEIPGVNAVHAVDAAGVHPLLLVNGNERYTPYSPIAQPMELLTIANHVLGSGQLSLAKFVWITGGEDSPHPSNIAEFIQYILERIHLDRDIHFYTNTSIDTLDYSGTSLNLGSKVVMAAYGQPIRSLSKEVPEYMRRWEAHLAMPGVLILKMNPYQNAAQTQHEIEEISAVWSTNGKQENGVPLIVLADDAAFVADNLKNFLWVTFTRCNPSHDIHGVQSFYQHKHWGCNGPMIIDARIKPHHAPVLEKDPVVEQKINRFFESGGPLFGWG